jgi:hypothetical protein
VLTGVLCNIARSLSIFKLGGDSVVVSLSGYPFFVLVCCFRSVCADSGVRNNAFVLSLPLGRATITWCTIIRERQEGKSLLVLSTSEIMMYQNTSHHHHAVPAPLLDVENLPT